MTRSLSDVVSSTYSMLLIALMLGSIAVAMVPAEEVPPAALLSEPEPQFAFLCDQPRSRCLRTIHLVGQLRALLQGRRRVGHPPHAQAELPG